MRRWVDLGWIGALGFLLVLLVPARPSFAGTLTVHFDIGISAVFTRPAAIQPDMQFQSLVATGSVVLTLEGTTADRVLIGDGAIARLSELTLTGASMLSTPMLDLARIEQDTLTQEGTATGVLDGQVVEIGFETNARLLFDAGTIRGQHDVESQCLGTICAFISFLGRPDTPFQNALPFALSLTAQEGDVLLVRAETAFPFRADGGPMTTVLIRGVEVSRNFVPEPSVLGLLALAALGAGARRLAR